MHNRENGNLDDFVAQHILNLHIPRVVDEILNELGFVQGVVSLVVVVKLRDEFELNQVFHSDQIELGLNVVFRARFILVQNRNLRRCRGFIALKEIDELLFESLLTLFSE